MIFSLGVGLALSVVVGLIGYWRHSLSASGVVGAIVTGTLVFGLGGASWGVLLVAFFASSSALSAFRARSKARLADKFQKGSRRDLAQALANGGWPAFLAAAFATSHWPVLYIAFVGAIATVTSDTWATEVGVLSTETPRLISTGRSVIPGTSGGVTLLGSIAAFLGAAFIGTAAAGLAALASWFPWLGLGAATALTQPSYWPGLILIAALSGFAGSALDSFVGATVQGIYYCDLDRKETERRIHSCGRATRLLRGYAWVDNDLVNLLASILGSGIAGSIWVIAFSGQ